MSSLQNQIVAAWKSLHNEDPQMSTDMLFALTSDRMWNLYRQEVDSSDISAALADSMADMLDGILQPPTTQADEL